MSFRIEKKIYIKKEQLTEFKNFLFKKNLKQIYKPRVVESIYFDNIDKKIYFDSLEGLSPRKKIRVRYYPENKIKEYFLEHKISSVEGRFKKNNKITLDYFNFLLNFGFFDSNYGICKPNLVVSYIREYFTKDDVRITFDTNINYNLFKKNIKKKDNNIIVELKTSIKKDIDHLIKEFPFQEIRFSKYCNGIELLQNS